MSLLDRLTSRFARPRAAPTQTIGVPGTAIYGGYVQSDEKNAAIGDVRNRQKTYSDILANVSIVAAGTRYFLNLTAKAKWKFTPSEADVDGRFAELAEQAITEEPETPWHRIVRRAAMYRFYGFSIQEWTAKRTQEGIIVFQDIAPRAQLTIEQWDTERDGTVLGVIQNSPQTSERIYIPRGKVMYLVDDSISDSPEGLGLLRHVVKSAETLARYEQLEGWGYETDLRGIPVGRAPLGVLQDQVSRGALSKDERDKTLRPMYDFIENHIRTSNLGLLLDSLTYESKDEAGRASSEKQWDVELLQGGSSSGQFDSISRAIERLNREMARVLGVEQLMLGDGRGSQALSKDKTNSFFLLIDGALVEIGAGVEDDLVDPLWAMNGWPEEMKPEVTTEAVRHTDVNEVTKSLVDMATAGAVLEIDDPAIAEVRDLLGISRPVSFESQEAMEDAALLESEQGEQNDEEMPDTDNEDEQQDNVRGE